MLDQEALAQLLGPEAAEKVSQAAKVRKQVESVQAALREENKRHRQEVDALEKELALVQSECPHEAQRYCGDKMGPSGLDSCHFCLVCGVQLP